MQKKLLSVKNVGKYTKQWDLTLTGGSFDYFNENHKNFLKKVSEIGRPLLVVVYSDKMLQSRRNANELKMKQQERVKAISALKCVDFVLILDKPFHSNYLLRKVKPKNLVFFGENIVYRKRRAKDINKLFPHINIIFVPGKRRVKKIRKILAILKIKNKTILSANNSNSGKHAEMIIIEKAKRKGLPLFDCTIWSQIPPCILCSEKIVKNGIRKVEYRYPYGNDDGGIEYLKNKGIIVKKHA